jgi:hypothetical protein
MKGARASVRWAFTREVRVPGFPLCKQVLGRQTVPVTGRQRKTAKNVTYYGSGIEYLLQVGIPRLDLCIHRYIPFNAAGSRPVSTLHCCINVICMCIHNNPDVHCR